MSQPFKSVDTIRGHYIGVEAFCGSFASGANETGPWHMPHTPQELGVSKLVSMKFEPAMVN
jgi:hypothetical protein